MEHKDVSNIPGRDKNPKWGVMKRKNVPNISSYMGHDILDMNLPVNKGPVLLSIFHVVFGF